MLVLDKPSQLTLMYANEAGVSNSKICAGQKISFTNKTMEQNWDKIERLSLKTSFKFDHKILLKVFIRVSVNSVTFAWTEVREMRPCS